MKNIVVLVSDSLRHDSVPASIAAESRVIPTLAPSLHTPTSFASLFTARAPGNHDVTDFLQDLDPSIPAADDRVDDFAFYDAPPGKESTINRHIFRSDGRDLDAMEPPFLWIERALDTHLPYGKVDHDRTFDFSGFSGRDYIEKGKHGDIDLRAEYRNGVDVLEDHFFRHIDELEERGILDETLVVLTSDHGELLGDRFLGRRRFDHNYPPMRELVEVPTVFWNAEVDADCMRLIDVLPTALGITGRDFTAGDGVDVRKNSVRKGINIMEDVKASFRTRWRFDGAHWTPTWRSRAQIVAKTLWGDLKRSAYRKGYKPLEERLQEKTEGDAELGGLDI